MFASTWCAWPANGFGEFGDFSVSTVATMVHLQVLWFLRITPSFQVSRFRNVRCCLTPNFKQKFQPFGFFLLSFTFSHEEYPVFPLQRISFNVYLSSMERVNDRFHWKSNHSHLKFLAYMLNIQTIINFMDIFNADIGLLCLGWHNAKMISGTNVLPYDWNHMPH